MRNILNTQATPKENLQSIRKKGASFINLFEKRKISENNIINIYKELITEQKNAEERDQKALAKMYLNQENEQDSEMIKMLEKTSIQRIADMAEIKTLIKKENIDINNISKQPPTINDSLVYVLNIDERYEAAKKET